MSLPNQINQSNQIIDSTQPQTSSLESTPFNASPPSTFVPAASLSSIYELANNSIAALARTYDQVQKIASQTKLNDVSIPEAPQRVLAFDKDDNFTASSFLGFQFPRTVPHMLRLLPIKGTFGAAYFERSDVNSIKDELPPIAGTLKALNGALDYATVIIDSEHPGFRFRLNPFDMSDTLIQIDDGPELRIEELSGGLVNGRFEGIGLGEHGAIGMYKLLLSLVIISRVLGRFIMVNKVDDQPDLYIGRNTTRKAPAYDRVTGSIPNDDWERFPHFFEVLSVEHLLPWFQDETAATMSHLPFGSVSTNVRNQDGTKMAEEAWVGSDMIISEANYRFEQDVARWRLNPELYAELLNSCLPIENDIGGTTVRCKFRRYSVAAVAQRLMTESHITFPGDPLFFRGFDLAFHCSEGFMLSVMDILSNIGLGVLQPTIIHSVGEVHPAVTSPVNSSLTNQSSFGQFDLEWTSGVMSLTLDQLSRMLTMELYPRYFDLVTEYDDFGAREPRKFLQWCMSIGVALSLMPQTYQLNRHVHAKLIYDFMRVFFPDEVSQLIANRGWGIDSQGARVNTTPNRHWYRSDCQIVDFTLLQPAGVRPNAVPQGKWRLFSQTLDFFQARVPTFLVQRRPSLYCPTRPNIVIPGQPMAPLDHQFGGQYPIETHLTTAITLSTQYYQIMSQQFRLSTRITGAMPAWEGIVKNFLRGYAEWYHRIYCMTAYNMALQPVNQVSNILDPYDWRAFYSVRDDPVQMAAHRYPSGPYHNPIPCRTVRSDLFVTPRMSQCLYAFMLFSAPNPECQLGIVNNQSGINWDDISNYIEGPGGHQAATIWASAVINGHAISEILFLVRDISTQTIFRQAHVRNMITRIVTERGLTARLFSVLQKFFGDISTGDGRSNSLYNLLPVDPRVNFPQIGLSVINSNILNMPRDVASTIRDSILDNFHMLTELIFDRQRGMIRLTEGVVASRVPQGEFHFDSTHDIGVVDVLISDKTTISSDEKFRHQIGFSAAVVWLDQQGMQHAMNNVMFVSVEALLDIISLQLGYRIMHVNVQIQRGAIYRTPIQNLLRYGLEMRMFTLHFMDQEVVQTFKLIDPIQLTTLMMRENALVDVMLRDTTSLSIHEIISVNTTMGRGVFELPQLQKVLTPYNAQEPITVLSGVTSYTDREYGVRLDYRRYFPYVERAGDGRIMTRNRHNVLVPAINRTPYALRTILLVYNRAPLLTPVIEYRYEH